MTIVHGFELKREAFIEELNTKAQIYLHVKSGAKLISLQNEDENKVFGTTFRTPPPDSTGLPHIMEHAVLGGSRKYQVKEPFVELLKGSLNTFVNAFTSSDWTAYPVASQNVQDFYNLVDVYLDSIFYPLLMPHHLDQEGWHYELEDVNNPLIYKGVVFNEMKGAYSSPEGLFGRYNQQSLFKDHVYGLDSGGDPQEIPQLTYEQFKAFHRKYYHPANAFIFFYGDDDPTTRLRLLDEYLRDYEAIQVDSSVSLAPRYREPHRVTHPYVVDVEADLSKKGMVQVNWLLLESSDPDLVMALSILSYALVSTPASPLRKALIDSGLGEELTGGGLSADLRELTFGVGLKGINVDYAPRVESLIMETLATLAADGFEKDMLEAALNTVEFRLRENNTGHFPRGLSLMLRLMPAWLHEGDPLAMLAYESALQAVKKALASDPGYFQSLIETHFLGNDHRSTVTMIPDPELADRLESEERSRLDQAREQMSEVEIQAIVENTLELKRIQETPDTPEALAAIPTLTLSDLDKQNKILPNEMFSVEGTPLLFHGLFTNGILYYDLGFDLRYLPGELLPYVNLFSGALTRMGTETEDYVKLSQRIGRKTGGISHTTLTSATVETGGSATWLIIRGKSTAAQSADLLDIMRDILLNGKLDDQERFRQIVLEAKAGQEAGLIQMGHRVVAGRLASSFSDAGWAAEQMGGVTYLFFLRDLLKKINDDWAGVLSNLKEVRRRLINRQALLSNVTLDEEQFSRFRPQLNDFISSFPDNRSAPVRWSRDTGQVDEALTLPARVNYVGKGANLYEGGYQLHGSVAAINNYLRTTYLWEKVRVQGGAYGAFCLFDRYSGLFSYLSYRDPNLMGTLANYDASVEFLRNLKLSDEERLKAIIGAIGDIDAYQLPDAKGYTSLVRYLVGATEENRQQLREEVLTTTAADFKSFAEALEHVTAQGRVVVLASTEAVQESNEGEWLTIRKVM